MTGRKILTRNPYEVIPSFLVHVASECIANRVSLRSEEILAPLRCLETMLRDEFGMSTTEACDLVREAIGWRASYRAERGRNPYSESAYTPERQVGDTDYCIPRRLFPRRRYVFGNAEDPLSKPGRWAEVSQDWPRQINDLVSRWWARVWRIAFGDQPATSLWVECYQSITPEIRCCNGGYGIVELSRPRFAREITGLDVDKGFLHRLRAAGLSATEGFLPVDVIIDGNGEISKVLAFRTLGQVIILGYLTPDDLADLTT